MSPFLRTVVMWLIAVAVPFQGIAAAAVQLCDPAMHGPTAMRAAAATLPDASRASHATHRHGVATIDAADPGVAVASADVDARHAHEAGHGASKGACTPCAACGAVAALPAEPAVFQPERLRDVFVVHAPGRSAPFLTDGPERPPRPILA